MKAPDLNPGLSIFKFPSATQKYSEVWSECALEHLFQQPSEENWKYPKEMQKSVGGYMNYI